MRMKKNISRKANAMSAASSVVHEKAVAAL